MAMVQDAVVRQDGELECVQAKGMVGGAIAANGSFIHQNSGSNL
jgi:hypothetical protein